MLNSLNLKGGEGVKKQTVIVGLPFFLMCHVVFLCVTKFLLFFFFREKVGTNSWSFKVNQVWSHFESRVRKIIICLQGGQS